MWTNGETKLIDEREFAVFLAKRNLTEDVIQAHISIVKEFEKYLKEKDSENEIDEAKPNDFDDFSKIPPFFSY